MNVELLDACIAKANSEGIGRENAIGRWKRKDFVDIDVPKFKPLKETTRTPPENGHGQSPRKSVSGEMTRMLVEGDIL